MARWALATWMALAACGAAAAPARGATPRMAGDRVIVRVSAATRAAWAPAGETVPRPPASLSAVGVRRVETLFPSTRRTAGALSRYFRLRLVTGADPAHVAEAVRALPGIESAETVPLAHTSAMPNDPSFPVQWHLQRGDGHDAHLAGAWDRTVGDSSVVLAITDTGVDWHHPDLASQIAVNHAEANGVPGVDDDGNGYIDDIEGWDFVTADSASVAPGEDPGPPDNDPSDWVGHGTLVAGTAAAATDNWLGVAGVAWGCRLLPVRIGYGVPGVDGGVINEDDAAAGVVYAADRGARVLNASWDSYELEALRVALDYAIAAGVVVVDAAGNHNTESSSANYLAVRGDCIDVAATDTLDLRANFSSYGTWADLCAPGTRIMTTMYNPIIDDHTYGTASGTSLSAPVVCGVLGLLRARFPSWPPSRVRERLLATADPIDDINLATYTGKLGRGRVNAAAAVGSETTFWQAPLTSTPRTALALGDFGVGQRGVVLVATDDGTVAAVRPGGVPVSGWPVMVGASPGPVASGMLGGVVVVVAGGADSLLHVLRADGSEASGWPAHLGAALRGGASLGLAGRPAREVVACGTEGHAVYLLDAEGAVLPGWPRLVGGVVRGSPALADLDGDGGNEVIVAAADSQAYAWHVDGTLLNGWPVRVPGSVLTPVAVGDLTGGGQQSVVVACNNGWLTALAATGVPRAGWPVQIGSSVLSPPALADLHATGTLDIACAAGTTVTVLDPSGAAESGWPVTTTGTISASPLLADLDGDGVPDVIAVTTSNAIHGYTARGAAVAGFPRHAGGALRGAPVLGDIGGDGTPNVATAAADSFIEAWTLPGAVRAAAAAPWATASHDAGRTGWTGTVTSTSARGGAQPPGAISDPPFSLRVVTRHGVAHGALVVALSAPHEAAATLEAFDVRGRRVGSQFVHIAGGSRATRVVLDGALRPTTGLLFLRLSSSGGPSLVRRVVWIP